MKKLILIILLIFIWCIVIFNLSNMPSEESNNKSEGVIKKAITKTLEVTNDSGVTNKHPSKVLLFKNNKLDKWKISLIAIILSFIYACTDEFHQMFVSGRSGEWLDVMIDTTGATIGIIIINIIFKVVCKIKKAETN